MKIRKIKNITNQRSIEAVSARRKEESKEIELEKDQMYSTLQEKNPMKKFRVLKAKILIEEDQSELRTKRITKNFKIKQISVTPNSNLVQIKD